MRKINVKGQANTGAIRVMKNSSVTIKNVDIECLKESGQNSNMYGIYASENSSINIKSGKIHTSDCACISTNGNDKPGCIINIENGELTNDNSYGIYMPAYGEINISGGEVQGINMRRGTLNITGGKISKPNNTVEAGPLKADPIGEYTNYSGLIWLGRTIAVLSGSKGYIKENNEAINITISDSVLLDDSFDETAPIHVYCLDTSDADKNQVVNITISDPSKVKVWTHEDIESDVAFCHGPNYIHKSFSTVYINGEKVYGPEEE